MSLEVETHCPTDDFDKGTPSGKCWGNGHYQCKECAFYREDFKRLGQEFIDFIHQEQERWDIIILTTITNQLT